MKTIGVAPRAIALALSLVLGLPHPAFALRVQAGLESDTGPELERKLNPTHATAAGLEEFQIVSQLNLVGEPPTLMAYHPMDSILLLGNVRDPLPELPPPLRTFTSRFEALNVLTKQSISLPGQLIDTLTDSQWGTRSVAFSPDGQHLFLHQTGRGDRVIVYDWRMGVPVHPEGRFEGIRRLAVNPDGGTIYFVRSRHKDWEVFPFDVGSGKVRWEEALLLSRGRLAPKPADLLISPDGRRLYVRFTIFTLGLPISNAKVVVYDLPNRQEIGSFSWMEEGGWFEKGEPRGPVDKTLALSLDGKELYVALPDPDPVYDKILTFDTESGKLKNQTQVAGRIAHLVTDPKGSLQVISEVVGGKREGKLVRILSVLQRVPEGPKVSQGVPPILPFQPSSAGLEEGGVPEYFPYRVIPFGRDPRLERQMGWRKQEYARRLVQDRSTGNRFLIKAKRWAVGSDGSPWYYKNDPVREYLGFRLARALQANVPDVVIPPIRERTAFVRYLRTQFEETYNPEDAYLVRVSTDYDLKDEAIQRKHFKQAFTRNLVAALFMRKYDFHMRNLGILRDSQRPLMMFDHDVSFHSNYASIAEFTATFSRNYWQPRGKVVVGQPFWWIVPNRLLDRIDLEELAAAVEGVERLDLSEFKRKVLRELPRRARQEVLGHLEYLQARQKTIRADALKFFEWLTSPRRMIPIQDEGGTTIYTLVRESSAKMPILKIRQIRAALASAGLEERQAALPILHSWGHIKSAAPVLQRVVVGQSVAGHLPQLEKLARLDDHFLVDEGTDTIVRLIELGTDSVRYYGGLEESQRFAAMAQEALISVEAKLPTAPEFLIQLREILALAGIPEGVLATGLEEFALELDSVTVGA